MQKAADNDVLVTPKVQSWLRNGEEVVVSIGGIVARLVPENHQSSPSASQWPDIAARHRAIFGGQDFSAEEIAAWREVEREGEEG